MKKIIIIIFAFLLFACEDIMEEKVYSSLTPIGFFETEQDIMTGVNGVYAGMQSDTWYISILWMADMMPGALCHNWNYQGWNTLNLYDSWDTWFNHWQIWLASYNIVGRANVLLDALKNSPVEEDIKVKYESEIRFIRAYVYFILTQTFGSVPLPINAPSGLNEILIPDSSNVSDILDSDFLKQVERSKIYDFLVDEFKFCESNLPTSYNISNKGRATKWAAKGMLAKLYLFLAGKQYNYETGQIEGGNYSYYSDCIQQLDEIINSGQFILMNEFQDVFGGLYDNLKDNNDEILFAIQFLSSSESGQAGEGSDLVLRYGIRGANITPYSILQARANDVFMNDFIFHNGVNNPRFQTTFLTEFINTNGDTVRWGDLSTFLKPHVRKVLSDYDYPNIKSTGRTDYGDDVILLRYADILLMHSEALNEMNSTPSAITLAGINSVRERANLPRIELPISQEELRDIIFKERKWELAYEGHYYFDCQRTGRLKDEIIINWHDEREITQAVVTNKYYVMPIPFWSIEKNPNLKQNFGY